MEHKDMWQVSAEDRVILRELAKRQYEDSQSPMMQQRIQDWKLLNNFLPGRRPMIHLEMGTFQEEILPSRLRCQGEFARQIEAELYKNFLNFELFDDDRVVPDYFPVYWDINFTLFNHPFQVKFITDDKGRHLGQEFNLIIDDLHDDLPKLGQTVYSVNREKTKQKISALQNIFGDILPVKHTMNALCVSPTQQVVHLMTMENMMYAMYDYPEDFHTLMGRIADDYLSYFDWLEKEHLLLPTVNAEWLGQGTCCFTNELPASSETLGRPLTTNDVWGYLDSQETVGISPQMFEEFIFPYYKKIAARYGLLSYGCCEPVHPIWDSCISKLDNLRKVSISPWCDEEMMGERLRGKNIVFQRKPSPNFLGVGENLDEDAIRSHINKTLAAAKGCTLEITQRDVYTINNSTEKARRYVQIIRECIADRWQG